MKKVMGLIFAVAMVIFLSNFAQAYGDNYFSSGTVILYENLKAEIVDPTMLFIIETYIPSFYDCNVKGNPYSKMPYFKLAYEKELTQIKDFLQQYKHSEIDINPENWVVVKIFISKEPGNGSKDLKFVITPKSNIKHSE